jgi:hypothetical protein
MLNDFESVQFDEKKQEFLVGEHALRIEDPFSKDSTNLGSRLFRENQFYPFLLARSSSRSDQSLLFFFSRKNNFIIVWEVVEEGKLKYLKRHRTRDHEIALMLSLTPESNTLSLLGIENSSKHAPPWASERALDLIKLLRERKKVDPILCHTGISKGLTSAAFAGYAAMVNCSTDTLLEFIDKTCSATHKALIIAYFDSYSKSFAESFRPHFYQVARFCALREFYTLITGMYVTVDPLSNQYVTSCSSAAWKTDKGTISRIIRYKSPTGQFFVERRGPAWLDVTTQSFFSNGLYITVHSRQKWGGVKEDELRFIMNFLCHNHDCNDKVKPIHLYIDLGGRNLGHLLWNELSGYIEFNRISNEVGFLPSPFSVSFPPAISHKFADTGPRAYLYPFLDKAIRLKHDCKSFLDTPISTAIQISGYTPAQDLLDSFTLVSLRYPCLSKSLVEAILEDFTIHDTDLLRVFINIRTHNKRHLNIVECIDATLKSLRSSQMIDLKTLSLELEYFSKDDSTIESIAHLCKSYNILCNHHVKYGILQLFQLVAQSNICIAPIGSGAIAPTWIFDKPTVLHADKRHINQLRWWTSVGGSKSNLISIPAYEITDESDSFYSDYRINPIAYAEAVMKSVVISRNPDER